MKEAVLALGTNLFDREKNLKSAIDSLQRLPETVIEQVSSIYITKPFQAPDKQNDYLNCCVKIKTNLLPEVLLGGCLGIEAAMGRIRLYKNAARIIDIDLLLYQDASICTENLILPHPRIKERAFVMVPLRDLYESKVALGFDFCKALNEINVEGVLIYKEDFNIKKNVICFYFWCICEFFCFIIGVKNRQYGRAFLDAFCFCMNVYGIFTWTKGKRSKNKANKVDQDSFNTSSSMIERI